MLSFLRPTVADQSLAVGYTPEDLQLIPEMAVLGVGCGNPTALADLKPGETLLDLGSGAGIDSSWRPKRWEKAAGASGWT